MDASYVMGLDLGPPGEPTGFAVLEWPATTDPKPENPYHLRHLERFPPNTSYPAVMAAVANRTDTTPLSGAPLVADVTAVGRQVIDRLYKLKPRICPIVISAGQTTHWVECVGQSVPKKELVSALQLALQTRRLKVAPQLTDAELLEAELAAFRLRRVSVNEADAAEWRVGRYDDLVFAVALACWYADQYPPQKPLPPRRPPERRSPIERLFGRRHSVSGRLFPNGGNRAW
jgi:hypothetical protein